MLAAQRMHIPGVAHHATFSGVSAECSAEHGKFALQQCLVGAPGKASEGPVTKTWHEARAQCE